MRASEEGYYIYYINKTCLRRGTLGAGNSFSGHKVPVMIMELCIRNRGITDDAVKMFYVSKKSSN